MLSYERKQILSGLIYKSTGSFECSTLAQALIVTEPVKNDLAEVLSECRTYCESLCDQGLISKRWNGTGFTYFL